MMIITLLGYMGSGKTLIANELSLKIGFEKIDLDEWISKRMGMTISEIFEKKGEIFFRKKEKEILEEILSLEKKIILSLGGGTPCYYDNIKLINEKSESIYLRANVITLVENLLNEKEGRPLIAKIADDKLPEFIGQHLLERNQYYSQAKYMVSVDEWNTDRIIADILEKIDFI